MAADGSEKQAPYCQIFLVVGALISHAMVFGGNLATSKAMAELGDSADGWSSIGLNLADALESELDGLLLTTTHMLTKTIGHISAVQKTVDAVLDSIGNGTDVAMDSLLQEQRLYVEDKKAHNESLQRGSSSRRAGVAILAVPRLPAQPPQKTWQETQARLPEDIDLTKIGEIIHEGVKAYCIEKNITEPTPEELKDAIQVVLQDVVMHVVATLNVQFDKFLEYIKPTLLQIGKWLRTFGPSIQAVIETFSTTIDKVTKLFDSILSSVYPGGKNEAQMRHDTYTLFDVENTGEISVQDLVDTCQLFGIEALAGTSAAILHAKYDQDGDGQIGMVEFEAFTKDPELKGAMSVVLRAYARRLSVISGNVAAARARDEVAAQVVQYITLISAKNETLLEWTAQRLINRSLPIEFSATVLKEFAMDIENPNKLTTVDVGQETVDEMYRMDAQYVGQMVSLLTTPEFWASEGFYPADQPVLVQRVMEWVVTSEKAQHARGESLMALYRGEAQAKTLSLAALSASDHTELVASLEVMTASTVSLVRERMKRYTLEQRAARAEEMHALYQTPTGRSLRSELLGGDAASSTANDTLTQMAVNSAVPAVPETLDYARFLSWNSSDAANRYQEQCFNYSSTSSNRLQSFSDIITGMVSKVSMFLNQMEQYSTPNGIERLERDLSMVQVELAQKITTIAMARVEQVLDEVTPEEWAELPWYTNTSQPKIANEEGRRVRKDASLLSTDASVKGLQEPSTSATAIVAAGEAASAALAKVINLLTNLQAMLPDVVNTLKDTRQDVSAVASQLLSTFTVFKLQAPPLFYDLGEFYRKLWLAYFVLFVLMTVSILAYAVWASGFVDGPRPPTSAETYERPEGFAERLATCWRSCTAWLCGCHDSNMVFWSVVIYMEFFLLALFIVAIALCIVSGLNTFVNAGCTQMYILGDNGVCHGILGMIRTWLSSFMGAARRIDNVCVEQQLLTCDIIGDKLRNSTICITIGSTCAVVFTFQMLVESAILHERARWIKLLESIEKDA